MIYLWTNYDDSKFYCSDIQPNIICEEVNGTIIIERQGKSEVAIRMNPLLRFLSIFAPIFTLDDMPDEINTAVRQEIENVLYKFLAQIDFVGGNTFWTIIAAMIAQELIIGHYGRCAADIFRDLPKSQQRIFSHWLAKQEVCKGKKLYYREVLEELFPGVHIYFYHDEKRFIVWMPFVAKPEYEKSLALWEILFLAVSCNKPKIFWQYHFGIIGREETMRLDEIAIY